MSEEEKKAIEELRKLPVTLLNCHLGGSIAIDTVLKLIEKQQKEIEKLKYDRSFYQSVIDKVYEDCVNKEKAREIIEDYYKRKGIAELTISKIQELLEETKE